jgi:hypothetical protein
MATGCIRENGTLIFPSRVDARGGTHRLLAFVYRFGGRIGGRYHRKRCPKVAVVGITWSERQDFEPAAPRPERRIYAPTRREKCQLAEAVPLVRGRARRFHASALALIDAGTVDTNAFARMTLIDTLRVGGRTRASLRKNSANCRAQIPGIIAMRIFIE